jgi:hypothetical protein
LLRDLFPQFEIVLPNRFARTGGLGSTEDALRTKRGSLGSPYP